jgi:hypothetical protein
LKVLTAKLITVALYQQLYLKLWTQLPKTFSSSTHQLAATAPQDNSSYFDTLAPFVS